LGDIKYIKFEILQIVSPSEDVKFSNVRGLYLRKYGICAFLRFGHLSFINQFLKKEHRLASTASDRKGA
jgi:hypothetical protein